MKYYELDMTNATFSKHQQPVPDSLPRKILLIPGRHGRDFDVAEWYMPRDFNEKMIKISKAKNSDYEPNHLPLGIDFFQIPPGSTITYLGEWD